MARPPRPPGAGIPHHITKRGHNRETICRSDSDFFKLRQLMLEGCNEHALRVHAYVLMSNHFHLLATPGGDYSHSEAIHWIAGTYARWFNVKYRRTGTLWEGRYWSAQIDSAEYFLSCQGYVELNPVRAGMVARPDEYPWSSFRFNGSGYPDPLVEEHDVYMQLGCTGDERRQGYRAFLQHALGVPETDAAIREATRTGGSITAIALRRQSEPTEKYAN